MPGRSSRPQDNVESRTLEVRTGQVQFTVVAGHQIVDDRQADAVTGDLFVSTNMQLQDGLRITEPRAVVVHPDVQSVTFTPNADRNPMSCPLGRVVQDVAEHLESIALVDSPVEL